MPVFSLRRLLAGAVSVLSMLCPLVVHADTPTEIKPENLTDAQVTASINKALDYIIKDVDSKLPSIKKLTKAERTDAGKLGEAGELMLETYALLYAGENLNDQRLGIHTDRMSILVDIATRGDFKETYTTSLQALALSQLPQTAEVRKAILQASSKLIKGRTKAGGYTYSLENVQGDPNDRSNGQYALLGVWAAADAGVEIPLSYWQEVDAYWRKSQLPTGGWAYNDQGQQLNTMTAAGVASLYVTQEFLNRSIGLDPRNFPAIERGLGALLREFNPKSDNLYYLYGVERAGLASGAKFFGKYDWYRKIAANLVQIQEQDGSFPRNFHGANGARTSCYGVLLLARGRAPILMNKLEYDGPWNARGRDSANLHARLSRIYERHLNWQSVPLKSFYEEWLDAPVLLITGSKDPLFTSDDVAKLRQYAQAGGIIFSVADGASEDFSNAMAKYAAQMLGPGIEGNYRQLPNDHPLFTVLGNNPSPPKVYGISNGVRELWVHVPEDYGAVWQTKNYEKKEAWELPASLLYYMAGKEGLRSKLAPLTIPSPAKPPQRQASMIRLEFDGNWNPEPAAWTRFAKLMALDASTQVELKSGKITSLPQEKPMLAHLGGIGKLQLSDEQMKALRDYIAGGGTLFIEAIGGNEEFAASAGEMLKKLYPEGKLKLVPADYSLINGSFSPDAAHLSEVDYRRFWTLKHGNQKIPHLEYMTIKGRIGVIFSAEDITSGLLGTNTWGIAGYTADSSFALARNILLYAWRNTPKKPGATQP